MLFGLATILAGYTGGCRGDTDTIIVHFGTQGIQGTINFWEGNFMPPGTGTVTPVERELRIYKLTTLDQVTRVNAKYPGVFMSSVDTRLIATVQSDVNGTFRVELPPGRYSLMVLEGDYLYVNSLGGLGEIFPIDVRKGDYTEIVFKIDYLAVY